MNVCIGCDQACIDRSIFDQRVSCIVNPRAGHELEQADADLHGALGRRRRWRPGRDGGGALVGRAGAAVTLFEAGARLGGQFRMACRIPGKHDYERTIEYFEAELAALGVDVRLGGAGAMPPRALSGSTRSSSRPA